MSKSSKNLDYKQMKMEYIAGGVSHRDLAQKYGVSASQIAKVSKREGWVKLRERRVAKTDAKIIDELSRQEKAAMDRYYRTVDGLFGRAEELIKSTEKWTPGTLKEMATALRYLKDCRDVRSRDDVKEQRARIRKIEQEIRALEDKGAVPESVVTIRFEGEGEEFGE